MLTYFPSCNFTKACPEAAEKISIYVRERHGAVVAGCCRPGHKKLSEKDTAVTVCLACHAVIREARPDVRETSLLHLIDADSEFPFPNLNGEEIAVQDCLRAAEEPELHEVVRSLLKKMNARVLELPENRERSSYCGVFPYNPIVAGNLELAPKFFGALQKKQTLMPAEKQEEWLKAYCGALPQKRVVCYCNSCLNGLKKGGARGVHLLELLFRVK